MTFGVIRVLGIILGVGVLSTCAWSRGSSKSCRESKKITLGVLIVTSPCISGISSNSALCFLWRIVLRFLILSAVVSRITSYQVYGMRLAWLAYRIVSKKSSNWRWNCRETVPMDKFNTRCQVQELDQGFYMTQTQCYDWCYSDPCQS